MQCNKQCNKKCNKHCNKHCNKRQPNGELFRLRSEGLAVRARRGAAGPTCGLGGRSTVYIWLCLVIFG